MSRMSRNNLERVGTATTAPIESSDAKVGAKNFEQTSPIAKKKSSEDKVQFSMFTSQKTVPKKNLAKIGMSQGSTGHPKHSSSNNAK